MHLDDVLTELVTDPGDRLLRVAYQLTHDLGAAQDLVQDALLRIYRRLRSSTEIVTDTVPERAAAGNLAGLAGQLSWQARRLPGQRIACTLMGGPQTNYLIGLAYPGGGTMRVAATDEPNQCVAASNGEFTSTGTIGPMVSKAFSSGRWPARQAVACDKVFQDIDRLGEDTAMVPAGETSLTICVSGKAHRFASGYRALVLALNRSAATRRSRTPICSRPAQAASCR